MSLSFAKSFGRDGEINPAGLGNIGWIAPLDAFLSIKVPAGAPDAKGFSTDIKIVATHTFKDIAGGNPVDEGFTVVDVEYDSAMFEGEGSKELNSDGVQYKITAFVAGNTEAEILFMQKLKAAGSILLVPDKRTGRILQFGSSKSEYVVLKSYKHLSGKFLGKKGFELELEAQMLTPFIYSGTITEKPV